MHFFDIPLLFSASRALLVHALYDFAGLVPRELMFEGHVTFERICQKIVKPRKFCWSQGAVTIHIVFTYMNVLLVGVGNSQQCVPGGLITEGPTFLSE